MMSIKGSISWFVGALVGAPAGALAGAPAGITIGRHTLLIKKNTDSHSIMNDNISFILPLCYK